MCATSPQKYQQEKKEYVHKIFDFFLNAQDMIEIFPSILLSIMF